MSTLEDRIRARITLLEQCLKGADSPEEERSLNRQINQLRRQLSDLSPIAKPFDDGDLMHYEAIDVI